MSSAHRDDDARDAHLRAALRHAPDHDAAPPPALSEQILAVARRSVRPAPEDRASWVRRARAAFASALDALTRPAGAAAFASLVLATVIGVMWREGAPPEALPERAPAQRVAPPTPSAPPAAQAPAPPAPAIVQSPSTPAAEASVSARTQAQHGAGAAKPAVEPKRRVTTASAESAPQAERSQAAQPFGATGANAVRARPDAAARDEARKATTSKAATSADAQEPTPAEAAAQGPGLAKTPPAPPIAAEQPTVPATPAPLAPSVASPPPMPRAAPLAAAPPAPSALRSSPASAVPDPFASLLVELGREAAGAPSSTTHRWQRSGALALPHGPIAQAWLAELQRATQGAWQAQGPTPVGAHALVLSNERGVVGRLELIEGGVLWHITSAPNVSWRAALPNETLKRLGESLAAWAGR